MNIKDKAKEYAEGKAINALTAAIESAYAEGYNAGFNDGVASKEGEKPDDLDDGVEYVDLGLPSGTKWAADYLKDKDGNKVYLPYCEATKLNIPTIEQYEELRDYCKLVAKTVGNNSLLGYFILGTNGNSVLYQRDFYFEADSGQWCSYPQFWLKSEEENNLYRKAANVYFNNSKPLSYFMGYKFPVILVK